MIALYSPELPPTAGGLADHTLALARSLEAHGAPPLVLGRWGDPARFAPLACRAGLRPTDVAAAAREGGAHAIVVQYIPFAFARRGLAPSLIAGARRMRRAGLRIAVVVHEPYVPFTRVPWLITGWPMRWQLRQLLRQADHVYTPVPLWVLIAERMVAANTAVVLAPVGATLPVVPASHEEARRELGLGDGDLAIGAFSPGAAGYLVRWVGAAMHRLAGRPDVVWVLFGHGSERLPPDVPGVRVIRRGLLEAPAVSRTMRALDLAVAPYVDGLTMRRTGAMLALAHGVPTVSSTGHLFDARLEALAACPPDETTFAALVAHLADDGEARRALADATQGYEALASVHGLARRLIADLGGTA